MNCYGAIGSELVYPQHPIPNHEVPVCQIHAHHVVEHNDAECTMHVILLGSHAIFLHLWHCISNSTGTAYAHCSWLFGIASLIENWMLKESCNSRRSVQPLATCGKCSCQFIVSDLQYFIHHWIFISPWCGGSVFCFQIRFQYLISNRKPFYARECSLLLIPGLWILVWIACWFVLKRATAWLNSPISDRERTIYQAQWADTSTVNKYPDLSETLSRLTSGKGKAGTAVLIRICIDIVFVFSTSYGVFEPYLQYLTVEK